MLEEKGTISIDKRYIIFLSSILVLSFVQAIINNYLVVDSGPSYSSIPLWTNILELAIIVGMVLPAFYSFHKKFFEGMIGKYLQILIIFYFLYFIPLGFSYTFSWQGNIGIVHFAAFASLFAGVFLSLTLQEKGKYLVSLFFFILTVIVTAWAFAALVFMMVGWLIYIALAILFLRNWIMKPLSKNISKKS